MPLANDPTRSYDFFVRSDVRKRHGDRKSTRLNSSHSQISYAVFCLKKKKKNLASPTTASLSSASLAKRRSSSLTVACSEIFAWAGALNRVFDFCGLAQPCSCPQCCS